MATVFFTQDLKGFLNELMIPMKNIITCASDGAAGMIGKYRGFTAFLTKAIPHVMTINCVVHRRWLSKGVCLNRVFCNFSSVVEFLDTVYIPLAGKLNKIQDQAAYLADIFLEIQ